MKYKLFLLIAVGSFLSISNSAAREMDTVYSGGEHGCAPGQLYHADYGICLESQFFETGGGGVSNGNAGGGVTGSSGNAGGGGDTANSSNMVDNEDSISVATQNTSHSVFLSPGHIEVKFDRDGSVTIGGKSRPSTESSPKK